MRRNLPFINYQESESEEEYNSVDEDDLNVLVSPKRPHQSATVSPNALLVPDPPLVDEVLNQVSGKLADLPSGEVSVGEEEVVDGLEVGLGDIQVCAPPPQIVMAERYDTITGEDAADVYTKLSTLKSEFNKSDPKFWFNNFERTIKHYGVKSQTTKYEALINQLTREATEEVKNILRQDEAELGATPYLTLKTELLSLYSPKPEDCYAKASSRVLVGLPSSLGKQIINDFCDCAKPIENKCCAKMAYGMK